jgi:hypothetical protein
MLGHSIVSHHFMEPESSILNSQELSTCSYPEPDQSSPHHSIPPVQDPSESHIHIPSLGSFIQRIPPGPRVFYDFRNKFIFYGEGLLAPRPTPKLEAHPLSFVRCCLFSIFAAILQAVVTGNLLTT